MNGGRLAARCARLAWTNGAVTIPVSPDNVRGTTASRDARVFERKGMRVPITIAAAGHER